MRPFNYVEVKQHAQENKSLIQKIGKHIQGRFLQKNLNKDDFSVDILP